MTYIDELHDEMMKSPGYRAAHRASRPVYQLVQALIAARAQAGVTQSEIAERMGTTQSAVARLEGGRSNPSMKTLERYAAATGTRLVVMFEPVNVDHSSADEEAASKNGAAAAEIADPKVNEPVSTRT